LHWAKTGREQLQQILSNVIGWRLLFSLSSTMNVALESIELKILRGLSHQLQKVSNHRRRIAATRCQIERKCRLIGSLETTVRDAVDVHPL
jgi:hypothetical protein